MTLKKRDKLVGIIDRYFSSDLEEFDKIIGENSVLKTANRELQEELDRAKLSKVKDRLKVRVQELEIENKDLRAEVERLSRELQEQINENIRILYNYDEGAQ